MRHQTRYSQRHVGAVAAAEDSDGIEGETYGEEKPATDLKRMSSLSRGGRSSALLKKCPIVYESTPTRIMRCRNEGERSFAKLQM